LLKYAARNTDFLGLLQDRDAENGEWSKVNGPALVHFCKWQVLAFLEIEFKEMLPGSQRKKKRSIGPKNLDYILIQVSATNTSISRRLRWFCVFKLIAKDDQLELSKSAMAVGLNAFVKERQASLAFLAR